MNDADQQRLCKHPISTPFGDVVVSAPGYELHVEEIPVTIPELPKKRQVAGVKLLRIRSVQPVTPERPLPLTITVSDGALEGGPNTGDWMEGMNFENEEVGMLQFGVRDNDWLVVDDIVAARADYGAHHMVQIVTAAPANATFFLSVAWRFYGDRRVFSDPSTFHAVTLTLPDRI